MSRDQWSELPDIYCNTFAAPANRVCRQTASCPPRWAVSSWMCPEPNIPLSHGWLSNVDAQWLSSSWRSSCTLHGCCSPGGITPPTSVLAKQPGLTTALIEAAAANLDYFDRTREKLQKCSPWHIKGKVTSVPRWAAARMSADSVGREQTFTTDTPRQWSPNQSRCPSPPWQSLLRVCVWGRRGEAWKRYGNICLFVFSNILMYCNVCKALWHL